SVMRTCSRKTCSKLPHWDVAAYCLIFASLLPPTAVFGGCALAGQPRLIAVLEPELGACHLWACPPRVKLGPQPMFAARPLHPRKRTSADRLVMSQKGRCCRKSIRKRNVKSKFETKESKRMAI